MWHWTIHVLAGFYENPVKFVCLYNEGNKYLFSTVSQYTFSLSSFGVLSLTSSNLTVLIF